MKHTYLNNLMSSFYLWLDHEILLKGEGFKNFSGKLYSLDDPTLQSANCIYGSEFRQWVYDSSIPTASIPSGIYLNNTSFLDKGVSGLCIDYNKGRVLFDSGISTKLNLSVNFAYKDYNIYYTDEKDERLLFENSYTVSIVNQKKSKPLSYNELPFPFIFIKNRFTENQPFAFGGQNSTETMLRCIVLSSNSFSLDSLVSILADSFGKNFQIFPPDKLPFNHNGDYKYGSFHYENECKNLGMNNLCYIKNVSVSKLDEIKNANINSKCVGAIVDFDVVNVRYI